MRSGALPNRCGPDRRSDVLVPRLPILRGRQRNGECRLPERSRACRRRLDGLPERCGQRQCHASPILSHLWDTDVFRRRSPSPCRVRARRDIGRSKPCKADREYLDIQRTEMGASRFGFTELHPSTAGAATIARHIERLTATSRTLGKQPVTKKVKVAY